MKFLSLDLEMNQPSGTIIQIGAVVGDVETGQILESLSVIINPHETLNPFIITLTGITQNEVDMGYSLMEGYRQLEDMHKRHQCYCNPITWGGGDSAELHKQLGEIPGWIFGRRWMDVKTVFQTYQMANNQKMQAGLAKAMTRVGMAFDGRKHDALDDAKNTFLLYMTLLRKFKDK